MKGILASLVALLFLGIPGHAWGNPISILNASFESPATASVTASVTSWTGAGAGYGVWNINDSPLGFWTVSAPDGDQVAFLSSAPHVGAAASLSQVLTDTLAANSLYQLAGYVGHPIGYDTSDGTPGGVPTIYTVALYAGGNLLNSISGTGPSGTFAPFNLVYNSVGSPYVGQALEVRLSSNQAQTAYDALSLSVPDGGATAVLLGLGMMGLAWMRRRLN